MGFGNDQKRSEAVERRRDAGRAVYGLLDERWCEKGGIGQKGSSSGSEVSLRTPHLCRNQRLRDQLKLSNGNKAQLEGRPPPTPNQEEAPGREGTRAGVRLSRSGVSLPGQYHRLAAYPIEVWRAFFNCTAGFETSCSRTRRPCSLSNFSDVGTNRGLGWRLRGRPVAEPECVALGKRRGTADGCFRVAGSELPLPQPVDDGVSTASRPPPHVSMAAELYPSLAQCAIAAGAFKILLFPA